MSAQPGLVTGASWPQQPEAVNPSSPSATGVGQGFTGSYMPNDGQSFAVLTTGDVGFAPPPNDSSSSGVDNLQASRNVHDLSLLKVDVMVPAGANCLSFDSVFYSEEYPEYVGSRYNDGFVAELDASTWAYDPELAVIDAPANFAFDENHNLLTVNSASFAAEDDTALEYDGSTRLLTAATPVTAGAHSLYLTVFDAGDGVFDTAVFVDNLRAEAIPPAECVAGARDRDTDGDALPDAWEKNGYDADGDGDVDVDLPTMGADPQHKDVFVELDAMKGLRLSQAAIGKVISAFAAAPVSNPDGSGGISLHVDNGPGSVMSPKTGATWGALSRASDIGIVPELGFFQGGSYNWSAYDTLKGNLFPTAREPIFHYAFSVSRLGDQGYSGMSRGAPASDFIVSLGLSCNPPGTCPGPTSNQAGTFMHELGHNLGLRHGGQDSVQNKPNYLSVMNYSFQMTGLLGGGFDYSRFDSSELPDLDENHLHEPSGFGTGLSGRLTLTNCDGGFFGDDYWQTVSIAGAVDFSCDGDVTDTDAHEDLNREGGETVLRSYDDWGAIELKGGAIGGEGLGVLLPETTDSVEAPLAALHELAAAAVPPPLLSAGPVTGVSASHADVHASVNPRGRPVEVAVQYGRDAAYGEQTPFVPAGEGNTPIAVAVALDGLKGGSYRYQVIARSPEHLVYSPDGVFDTSGKDAPPPVGQSFSPPLRPGAVPPLRLARARLDSKVLSPRRALVVRFELSAAADVSLAIERRSRRWRKVKALSVRGRPGVNRVVLRQARLRLASGGYRLRLRVTASDGRQAVASPLPFRVAE